MDMPGRTVSFSAVSSEEEVWQDQFLRTKFLEWGALILVPLTVPVFFLWIFRFKDMGMMNLSIGDSVSAVCALLVALLARNWGKPIRSNGGFFALLSLFFLLVEAVVLVACDSGAQMSELVSFSRTNLCDPQKVSALIVDIDQNSHEALYAALCFCGMIPAVLETHIIFTGGK